jgi:hypothetical protein
LLLLHAAARTAAERTASLALVVMGVPYRGRNPPRRYSSTRRLSTTTAARMTTRHARSRARSAAVSLPARRLHPEMVVSVVATVISVCALVTTYWQTRINREWQQASVWPRLTFTDGRSSDTDTATGRYELGLANVGIGPALITKVTVRYRGQELPPDPAQPRLSAFFHKTAVEREVKSQRKLETSQHELLPGTVIAPAQGANLLIIKGDIAYLRAIQEGLPSLEVAIQYASVYGETWEITYPKEDRRFVGWNRSEVH